jgi:hypothetical protein
VALGTNGTAAAGEDGWLVLAAWGDAKIITVRTAKVGGPEGIQAGVKYRLSRDGEFEKVTP